MTPGARLAAAIEVLAEVIDRHRPAPDAIHDWGRAHRFAGSGDRGAITNLVNAALRRRLSAAFVMDDTGPRALALGALRLAWRLDADAIAALCGTDRFAPEALSASEAAALAAPERLAAAPAFVRGDVPEWLMPAFSAAFADGAAGQGAGLAGRAPLDMRVNTLKATRERVEKALARHGARPTTLSPVGLRIALADGPARPPHVESDAAHGRGHFEVQDEGSQVAALLAGAAPGLQVVDYCAGAGGKALAMAAAMENSGQIYAHDADERRLRPIFERLRRAGARNVQVRGGGEGLAGLDARADLVLVDAPCSGTGVWRRRPDAKWRLGADALAARLSEQAQILDAAAGLVAPGGRLAYVTCSVLPAENTGQVTDFLSRHGDFALVPSAEAWATALPGACPASADGAAGTLLLTPASHGTDGFFIAILRRA